MLPKVIRHVTVYSKAGPLWRLAGQSWSVVMGQ